VCHKKVSYHGYEHVSGDKWHIHKSLLYTVTVVTAVFIQKLHEGEEGAVLGEIPHRRGIG
jgi:hypothetical protein